MRFFFDTSLIISLFLIKYTLQFRCYACENQIDCNDPFITNKQYFYTCPTGFNICQKIVYKSEYGLEQVVRKCASLCPVGQISYNGFTATSYCCNSAECNTGKTEKAFK
ncbi:unnamed protein product [Brachionus calyciflorus]|uniref:Snake toxin/toxin-like domain-containing protein n=1 Tax=Brachionus calyciflorus TaxID=104777 RepID=A0A813PAN9_9BILA|nr:unnamed protein product [Brachionus calyciflorus]